MGDELLTLPEHLCLLPVLVGFVLINLYFFCSVFVDHFMPFYCLSFDLRLLVTPLLS